MLVPQVGEAPRAYETLLSFAGPVALLLGSEECGLDESSLAAADERVRIPMHGAADSLNVSVSAGVLLWEAVRQRTSA